MMMQDTPILPILYIPVETLFTRPPTPVPFG